MKFESRLTKADANQIRDLWGRLAEALAEIERLSGAQASIWDAGWHEHFLEWDHQRRDPNHPITKNNPFEEKS